MDNNNGRGAADEVVRGIKKDFTIVGTHRVHSWYAWAIVGIVFGMALGIIYVANRSVQFDASQAKGPRTGVRMAENNSPVGQGGIDAGSNPNPFEPLGVGLLEGLPDFPGGVSTPSLPPKEDKCSCDVEYSYYIVCVNTDEDTKEDYPYNYYKKGTAIATSDGNDSVTKAADKSDAERNPFSITSKGTGRICVKNADTCKSTKKTDGTCFGDAIRPITDAVATENAAKGLTCKAVKVDETDNSKCGE